MLVGSERLNDFLRNPQQFIELVAEAGGIPALGGWLNSRSIALTEAQLLDDAMEIRFLNKSGVPRAEVLAHQEIERVFDASPYSKPWRGYASFRLFVVGAANMWTGSTLLFLWDRLWQ